MLLRDANISLLWSEAVIRSAGSINISSLRDWRPVRRQIEAAFVVRTLETGHQLGAGQQFDLSGGNRQKERSVDPAAQTELSHQKTSQCGCRPLHGRTLGKHLRLACLLPRHSRATR